MFEYQYSDILARIQANGGRIVVKKGWFWTTLHYLVMIVTFGSNRKFRTSYLTTIGPVIGVPEGWEGGKDTPSRVSVLEHELIHIKQCKKVGLGSVWLGFPIFMVLYLLLPLPVGFAYFRWRFERAAYVHGINVRLRFEYRFRQQLIDHAVHELTSGAYGWTWSFKSRVRRYFEANVEEPSVSIYQQEAK